MGGLPGRSLEGLAEGLGEFLADGKGQGDVPGLIVERAMGAVPLDQEPDVPAPVVDGGEEEAGVQGCLSEGVQLRG